MTNIKVFVEDEITTEAIKSAPEGSSLLYYDNIGRPCTGHYGRVDLGGASVWGWDVLWQTGPGDGMRKSQFTDLQDLLADAYRRTILVYREVE